ncbi:38117_t:CDS:2, partial [Gigaspora margarita]
YECLLVDSKHELDVLMATIDYTGFPVSYLYVAASKNRDMRSILTKWFLYLRNHGIDNVNTFLSDKDFAQISSAQLSSFKISCNISYNAIEANRQCSFIDPSWTSARNKQLSNQKTNSKVFCAQFYRNIL